MVPFLIMFDGFSSFYNRVDVYDDTTNSVQVSKELVEKCGLNRIKKKQNNQNFKRVLFP